MKENTNAKPFDSLFLPGTFARDFSANSLHRIQTAVRNAARQKNIAETARGELLKGGRCEQEEKKKKKKKKKKVRNGPKTVEQKKETMR